MVKRLNFIQISLAYAFILIFAGWAFPQAKNATSTMSPQRTAVDLIDVQTVAFCDLIRYPQRYNRKIVRTQAIAVITFETAVLYDPTCVRKDRWTEYRSGNKEAYNALRDYLSEPKPDQPSRAKVTVIGRLDGPSKKGYGHLNFAKFRFVVMRVEHGESVAPDVPYPWDIKK